MIAGVVLAAGSGTRIGYPKALLELRAGESFVERARRVLAEGGADPVFVVSSTAIRGEVRRLVGSAGEILINDAPDRGQLSSLQIAIERVAPSAGAVIVLPVDVPLVTVDTVRRLIGRWRESRPAIVRPVSGARHGHPVIFDRAIFAELTRAAGPGGAKPVVRSHVTGKGDVEVEDDGAFVDIDSAEDYRRAFGRLPNTVTLR